MIKSALRLVAIGIALLGALPAPAAPAFNFAVIPHPADAAGADVGLREAIRETDARNLAFVVANGIKAADESCSDTLYEDRKKLLQRAQNGLVVSLAASDWTACKEENGESAAIGRLSRLRELLFPEDFSFGAAKIPLVRQSTIPRFRAYVENARWEIGGVMFATIDLPADNNHFLYAAGRNSEFEDRVIANRSWLHRIFSYAKYQKLKGIVLFCDGNPLAPPARRAGRDGYQEVRRQLQALGSRFPGRVLIVHNAPDALPGTAGIIHWHGRLGDVGASAPWLGIAVEGTLPATFNTFVPAAAPPALAR